MSLGRRLDGHPGVAERDDADHDALRAAARRSSRAVALAASSRDGFASSAAMLAETSKVSISVPSSRGDGDRRLGARERDDEHDERADDEDPRRAGRGAPVAPAGGVRHGERPRPSAVTRPRAPGVDAPRAGAIPERHEHEQHQRDRPQERHAGTARRRLRSVASRTIERTRSSSVEMLTTSTPNVRTPPRARPRVPGRGREPLAEPPVARVDLQLLPGLGVLDEDDADVRQLALARVDEPDREQLVTLVEEVQLTLPAGRR